MKHIHYEAFDCIHAWPDDWDFGPHEYPDPRHDPRYLPVTWEYLDDHFGRIAITQVPLCVHQAIDQIKVVETRFSHMKPPPKIAFLTRLRLWIPNDKMQIIWKESDELPEYTKRR